MRRDPTSFGSIAVWLDQLVSAGEEDERRDRRGNRSSRTDPDMLLHDGSGTHVFSIRHELGSQRFPDVMGPRRMEPG